VCVCVCVGMCVCACVRVCVCVCVCVCACVCVCTYITHMKESRHTYEWVMSYSHICKHHVTHINASRHVFEWVMSCRPSRGHVTYEYITSHMNTSRHIWIHHVTYEYITSHMNTSRAQVQVPHYPKSNFWEQQNRQISRFDHLFLKRRRW